MKLLAAAGFARVKPAAISSRKPGGWRFPLRRPIYALSLALCAFGRVAATQAPQALNATVSDFGSSFTFSAPPICPGCVETEFGFLNLEDGNYVPAIISIALPTGHTDVNFIVNLLDSEAPNSKRATQFGNRLDFVVRQQVATKGNFALTLAPRGTIFVRGTDGGRAGLVAAGQDSWGKDQVIVNLIWTGAIGVSAANPRSDYLTQFDYTRALQERGTALFLGFQQEHSGGDESAATEVGVVIPFRNGQVELASQQLNLNTNPQVQFQANFIVNWGKVFGRK